MILFLSVFAGCSQASSKPGKAPDVANVKIAKTDKTLQIDAVTLVYTDTISDAEASRVREFFLRNGGFKESTLPFHLLKSEGTYKLSIFVGAQLPQESDFRPMMQSLADALSREVFLNAPVEVLFRKENLEVIWSARSVKEPK